MNEFKNIQIIVIGLGYVGLPLAVAFGKKYSTIGIDTDEQRIRELKEGYDRRKELDVSTLLEAKMLSFSNSLDDDQISQNQRVFIITVPTPIDVFKKPDLSILFEVSAQVGKILKKGDIVIYESTVYPGCTEDDCVPILEKESSLFFNKDFFCGYSPERINPGDKEHTLIKVKKITSGSTEEIAFFVDKLYDSIIIAGTYKAQSIRVAEAAKIVENCQRDINIALVNELAVIFDKMNIDTLDVLEAAGTKWNFLSFRPGLVGGHCVGVDSYYITDKAMSVGYQPELLLAGRKINDSMGYYVAGQFIKELVKRDISIKGSRVLILGITFKENCTDIRNTKVIDIFNELNEYGCLVEISDPWANRQEVLEEYKINLSSITKLEDYLGIIIAVAHKEFVEDPIYSELKNYSGVIYDVKGTLPQESISRRL